MRDDPAHEKSIYSDPNRVITAKDKFGKLFMKSGDEFCGFCQASLCPRG
jgi:hypothetical protein